MYNFFAQKLSELLAGVLVSALGIYVLVEARGFPTLPGNDYGADLFPRLIGYGMAAGGAWLALASVRPVLRHASQRSTEPFTQQLEWFCRLLLPVLLVIGYLLLADTLGAIPTLVLIVAMLMLISGVRPLLAVPIALLTAALIWLSFVHMLKVPLPLGLMNG
ncbi:tripartite tricarboxylate transporter TctB family protein [Thauera sp. SDU_THAU2]|uniref:tripartite tricarboxylate transporter TctB family protein n=1 Tax=Thauera sp. SDU_THAU2 TaxID=3136633 RepID=UPI00311F3320